MTEGKHKILLEFADGRTLTITTKNQVNLAVEPHMESVMTTVFEDNGRTHVLPFPTIEGFHVRIELDLERSELEKLEKSLEETAKEIGGSDENSRPAEVPQEH